MTTPRELMATVETRVDREEGESQRDTEERLCKDTLALVTPRDDDLTWEGDTLVWRFEIAILKLLEWSMRQSIGEWFFNDSVVCPTCKRVNEYKP